MKRLSRAWENIKRIRQSREELINQVANSPNPAALEAMATLKEKLYLQDGTMNGADLTGARLQNVRLARANLEQVTLSGADLTGCYLGATNLKAADLTGAKLADSNLREVILPGANLRDADVRGSHMATANLREADLRGADLREANLWGAYLYGANLTGADMSGANLQNIRFDEQTILPDGQPWTPESDLERFTNPDHPDFWTNGG